MRRSAHRSPLTGSGSDLPRRRRAYCTTKAGGIRATTSTRRAAKAAMASSLLEKRLMLASCSVTLSTEERHADAQAGLVEIGPGPGIAASVTSAERVVEQRRLYRLPLRRSSVGSSTNITSIWSVRRARRRTGLWFHRHHPTAEIGGYVDADAAPGAAHRLKNQGSAEASRRCAAADRLTRSSRGGAWASAGKPGETRRPPPASACAGWSG